MKHNSILAAVTCIAALTLASVPTNAADRPPNVVFILADDLGYRELGSYGQEKIRTPNLDRLASEGMRLTQHYSGNAVCAPSRCLPDTRSYARIERSRVKASIRCRSLQ